MLQTDYHLHSAFSSDSITPLEEQIQAAIHTYHLQQMCITDHMDFDFPDNPEGYTFQFDMDDYLTCVHSLQKKYKEQIDLRVGIELGMLSHLGPKLQSFMKQYGDKLDFVIASVHLVNNMDPYDPPYFQTYGETRGIELYLENILESLDVFPDFNVFGHLDYVVRYAPHKDAHYRPLDYMDLFDAILKKIISMGKGIELNTAGLKAGLAFAHPHPSILKRYKELGGEIISVGSDGHKPEHIAYDFAKVPGILKEAGFDYYTVFKNRQPQFVRIPD